MYIYIYVYIHKCVCIYIYVYMYMVVIASIGLYESGVVLGAAGFLGAASTQDAGNPVGRQPHIEGRIPDTSYPTYGSFQKFDVLFLGLYTRDPIICGPC